jgi:multidrug resistance efflux pump
VKGAAWLVGPKHTVWKLVGAITMLATAASCIIQIPYRFGAPFELQAVEKRIVSAPFEGTIERLGEQTRPGDEVRKGQTLVVFDSRERRLSANEASAQIVQYEKEAAQALERRELDKQQEALARAEQARSRLELLTYQIEQSTLVAPIDGRIVAGDLRDRVKASVKLGDKLMEVADLSKKVVVAKVGDQDIGLLYEGQTGEITPRSDPSKAYSFVVSRIVPLAQTHEGENAFDVYCELTEELPDSYRPGMEGQARFDGETHTLIWIATRRVIDTARLKLWW